MKKIHLSIISLFIAFNVSGQINRDSLAFELSMMYGLDQGIRNSGPSQAKIDVIATVDSLNFDKFINFVRQYGFPNEELLGVNNFSHESVNNAGNVVLIHNCHRVMEPEIYDLLKNEVTAGRFNPVMFSWIIDKYYILYKGYSLFGSPYMAIKKLEGVSAEHKEESDKAHIDIGLEPLSDSKFIR